MGIKAEYLHSEVDTLERVQILKELRDGVFDVLVGINLLREGLDLPEVSLVCILDADKEGFLRSETALIQTCGRAARNKEGRVILYADKETKAIQKTIEITQNRRKIQQTYNQKHQITPQTTKRDDTTSFVETPFPKEKKAALHNKKQSHLTPKEIKEKITTLEKKMKKAAKNLQFEEAAALRDQLRTYQNLQLLEDQPL